MMHTDKSKFGSKSNFLRSVWLCHNPIYMSWFISVHKPFVIVHKVRDPGAVRHMSHLYAARSSSLHDNPFCVCVFVAVSSVFVGYITTCLLSKQVLLCLQRYLLGSPGEQPYEWLSLKCSCCQILWEVLTEFKAHTPCRSIWKSSINVWQTQSADLCQGHAGLYCHHLHLFVVQTKAQSKFPQGLVPLKHFVCAHKDILLLLLVKF